MDNQLIGGQVHGEIVALYGVELKLAAHVLRQPSGYFNPADIIRNRMMAARFGHQYPVPRPQIINGQGARHLGNQIAAVAREENRKTRKRNLGRCIRSHF